MSFHSFKPCKVKRIRRRFPGTDQDCLSKDWKRVGMDADRVLRRLSDSAKGGTRNDNPA